MNWLLSLALVFVTVAPGNASQQVIKSAAHLAPSANQLAWQHEELTGFIHFGPNTFDNREWGTGKESPDLFNPSAIDTDQWARTFADAGFKKVIIVTKHHDGFVLWPTRYTKHSVKYSRWENGRGDVVGSFVTSAHKYGLKVGFYLSPSDLYQAQPGGVYATGSAKRPRTIPTLVPGDTRKPKQFFHVNENAYNTYYMNELYELLTQYGRVDEIWFDGANPLAPRVETYDFPAWYQMVHALQPHAIIFPVDINWVGNEDGAGRDSQWSVVPLTANPRPDQTTHVVDATSDSLGSDATLTNPKTRELRWMPSECDARLESGLVSVETKARAVWFWQPHAQPKSLAELQALYFSSVGHNCQLLLDVPPNRSGRFDNAAVARMHEFGEWIRTTFAHPLTANAAHPATFSILQLQEEIAQGQRVAKFAVEANVDGGWREIAGGTTIGYKRLIKLNKPVTARGVRVRVLASRDAPLPISLKIFR